MQDNLLRFNRNQKYLVWDLETEGLNYIRSRPWQVSWLVGQGDRVISRHDHFILWEDLEISEDAARITRFDQSRYLKLAEDPLKVFKEFSSYVNDPNLIHVGQNILNYDVYIYKLWSDLLGQPHSYNYIERLIDTKALSTAILKKIPVDKDNFLSWQYKMMNMIEKGLKTRTDVMLKYFDIPFDPKKLHDSAYDVDMTYKLFRKQIFSIDI